MASKLLASNFRQTLTRIATSSQLRPLSAAAAAATPAPEPYYSAATTWHVEDFLDSSTTPPQQLGTLQTDDGMLPFLDDDFESNLGSFSSENLGIWVPQPPSPLYPASDMVGMIGFKETKEATNLKANNKRWRDDGFTVPQISPPSTGSKRSRPYW